MAEQTNIEDTGFNKRRVEKAAVRAYERRDYEAAVNVFTELILRSEQTDIEWYIKRCDCYQHLNQDSEAMHDANTIVKLHPESYKGYSLLGMLHQIQGHYDDALFCYFDCLETIWLSGEHSEHPQIAEKCLNDIMRSAYPVAELPQNISKQSVLTQLYILGNSLRREVHHTMAIRSLEVTLIIYERSKILTMTSEDNTAAELDENESLKMKIHFVLAQCQQAIGKFEESIENFKTSLSIALRNGDVSYETKAYLSLSALCLDQDRPAEAASFYVRLLAVGDDVLSAVGYDHQKFREHWSIEMEANILLNLCIAFKSLRLYDEALKYALRYDSLIGQINTSPSPSPDQFSSFAEELRSKSVPAVGFSRSMFAQKSVDLSGVLQSKFILGDLHELQGDLDSAMRYYMEWMHLSEVMAKDLSGSGVENPYLLDAASSLSCQGSIFMKKKDYKNALECFKQQAQIGRLTKIPQLQMEAALSRGDALIALGRVEEARNTYNFALKLSRQTTDDLEPECMCMWKVASVFAAELRFTHAAYYCEQAVALAHKCGKRSVLMKLKFELALYYQHSNSNNELQKGAEILIEMIKFQEDHIYSHRCNGGKYFHEEEVMLSKCYDAMQVILHKLGFTSLGATFGEAWRRRKFIQLSNKPPQIPDVPLADVSDPDPKKELHSKADADAEEDNELDVKDHRTFLPDKLPNNAFALTYNLCGAGFLAQIIDPGVGVIASYLSSDHDAKPFNTRGHIEQLVGRLGKIEKKDQSVSAHLCNIYNTEIRCLPRRGDTPLVPIPHIQTKKSSPLISKDSMASGDHAEITVKPKDLVEMGKEGAKEDLVKKQTSVFEELYEILLRPIEEILQQKVSNREHVYVLLDKDLLQIPFDVLTSKSGHQFGEDFHVTLLPCFHFLQSKGEPAEKSARVDTSTPIPESVKTKSPRVKSSAKTVRRSVKSARPSTSRRKQKLDEEIKQFRKNELMKSYSDEKSLLSLKLSGLSSSINRLVTQTARGTNIITSPRYIPPYKQVSNPQKCTVIGCPNLPKNLIYEGQMWKPRSKLPVALKECKKVSEYFDVIPILGAESTKERFLKELKTSTLLHIAVYANIEKCHIALAPNSFPNVRSPPDEESYLINSSDISKCNIENLQLAVLSCGHGWPNSLSQEAAPDSLSKLNSPTTLNLASLLLHSGASCILHRLWNVSDVVCEYFFFHFYNALQNGSLVSNALKQAKEAVKQKYPDPKYWAGFVLLGSDVYINLSQIRKSQLHASLDLVEAEQLNLKYTVDDVVKPETAMRRLQEQFGRLTGHLSLNPLNRDVVGALIELLEEAMDRLTADSNTDRPVIVIPALISETEGALGLLSELGFDFQPADSPVVPPSPFFPVSGTVAAVVFPHWNKDGLLLPAHQALTGLQDISSSDIALQCLARLLPLSQAMMCSIIDLFAVTRHTPEVQLRVYDMSVNSVWGHQRAREYLQEVGFLQVHSLLVFFKTSKHRTLLIASLQMFASLCLHRDQSVLEHLNITTLGESPPAHRPASRKKMESLNPVILPRNEIILTSSWMSEQISTTEERERKLLANKLSQTTEKYKRVLQHAKWWHKNLLTPQAEIKLSTFGAEKPPKPLKRKVKSGATPSCQRESIDGSAEPRCRDPAIVVFAEAMEKRDYANFLAQKRCQELEARLKATMHEIYKEYAVNG